MRPYIVAVLCDDVVVVVVGSTKETVSANSYRSLLFPVVSEKDFESTAMILMAVLYA
jgi:hypothetical protein